MGNILVTGGAGFIGSNLVDKLISANHKVFVVDNMSTGIESNLNSLATYYFYDIGDFINNSDKLLDLIRNNNIQIVYHLAALADVRISINDPIKWYGLTEGTTVEVYECNCSASLLDLILS